MRLKFTLFRSVFTHILFGLLMFTSLVAWIWEINNDNKPILETKQVFLWDAVPCKEKSHPRHKLCQKEN